MKEVRKEKKEVRTDEIVVRFKNNGHHRKINDPRIKFGSKKHCVGDYSCCGKVP